MKSVSLANDWEAEYRATRKNAATGTLEPATGLSSLTARLSLTDGGAAIHSTLNVALIERGATGIYSGVMLGPDLQTQLNALAGTVIYEVFAVGTSVLTSIPRLVQAIRRP